MSNRVYVAGAVVAAGLAVAVAASANGFDPRSPAVVVVGEPPGPAPAARVDPRGHGRARDPLPRRPAERWRRELPGGLDVSPVVAPGGELMVALSTPDILRIDGAGRQRWRRKIGDAPVVAAPVLTSDGGAFVVTADGLAWKIGPEGAVRWLRSLPVRTRRTLSAPLAREDGSVVVAGERGLVVVDAAGTVVARASLPTRPAGGLVPWRGGVLAALVDGRVVRWIPPRAPEELGTFEGQLLESGLTLASDQTLVAVVDRREVMAFDLVRRAATPLISVGVDTSLDGHVALGPDVLWVAGTAGELWGLDAAGAIARRAALEPPRKPAGAGLFVRSDTGDSAPLVVDDTGTLAFARSTGKVGVVHPDGTRVVAEPRFCGRPLAVLPAGPAQFYVTCRSGSIALFGEADGTPAP